MNKKIILIVIAIIICLIIYLIVSNISSSNYLELTYQTNGGVPFNWEYEIENPDIVEFVKSYIIEDENKKGLVGAPIKTNYVFKGVKKGKTTITFKYVNVIDGTIEKEDKLNVKVDKRGNISLYIWEV